LDNLPASLEYLDCCHNNISQLINIPANLKVLKCSRNLLKNLNNLIYNTTKETYTKTFLPDSIQELDCGSNRIKKN